MSAAKLAAAMTSMTMSSMMNSRQLARCWRFSG
jgi:hypothetical protein